MENKKILYGQGSKAYLVENSQFISEVTILSAAGGLYKVRFADGAGTCVKKHRLYQSEKDAEEAIQTITKRRRRYKPPDRM